MSPVSYTFQLKCAVSTCQSDANPQNVKTGQAGDRSVSLHFCDAHMLHLVALERKEQAQIVHQRPTEGKGQEVAHG